LDENIPRGALSGKALTSMMDEAQSRDSAVRNKKRAGRMRLRIVTGSILLLILLIFLPPWVSIGRYQGRIAQILSASVGRPVQISSVEMRLLPWPGFVMTNLSIAEDPAYGAEPVLHANTVRATIRLLPLWRGRIEIGGFHMDEASLNLVRAGQGRWNLDPLFRTVAARAGATADSGGAVQWPSLDATNSRINIKNGAEKLPFSVVNTDLSLWQANPGEWRIRLQGQPARTDVALELGDTGTVRIEASLKRGPSLGQSPVQLDLDWREAQLGQLSRLLIGSDPGWRGDLTGNLHLEGTPSAAQISTRLRATGVHRAEFAPRTPLDFDANCSLLFHYAPRTVENLICNSPLGNGRIRVTGGMPGGAEPSHATVELDRIPVGAGLDVLRTMRSGLAPDLEAAGTVSGRIDYASEKAVQVAPVKTVKNSVVPKRAVATQGPLSGSVTIEGFELSGGALTQPLRVPKVTLQAIEVAENAAAPFSALEGTVALSEGGAGPLNVNARFSSSGYEATFRGQAAISRARELAQTAGWSQASLLKNVDGDPLVLNLMAAGPWLDEQPVQILSPAAAAQAHALAAASGALGAAQPRRTADGVTGTIAVHDATWNADYLANPVQIAQVTLHLETSAMRWDSVDFEYGPVKGSATITVPLHCVEPQAQPPNACAPRFQMNFGELDAKVLEAALLGAREKGTMLSSLIERLNPAAAPSWPELSGSLDADVFVLGPVKIEKASAAVIFATDHADFSGLQGNLLGGQLQGSGTVRWAGNDQKQPSYSIVARCDRLNAVAVGQLLGQRWTGGSVSAGGNIELVGFTAANLAASAKGTLHFDWSRGAMASGAAVRFDEWSGDAQIGDGAVTLGKNEVTASRRKQALEGSVEFGTPPKVKIAEANQDIAKQ
jgi:AsmA family